MPHSPTVLLKKPMVLVVDDEESVRHWLRRVMEEDGYQVLTASDGAHALSLLRRSRFPVQLVITDVSMPRMNGVELAAYIALEPSPPPLLFMSGGHQYADLPGPMLSKPFRAHEVKDLARLVLTGESPCHCTIAHEDAGPVRSASVVSRSIRVSHQTEHLHPVGVLPHPVGRRA